MSNELIPQQSGDLVPVDFDVETESVKTFLPRFTLYSSKSNACAEGLISIGHYGLADFDEITDLGKEVDVLVCSMRAKALDTSGEELIIEFDQTSDTFNRIKATSKIKDSGCMVGREFLVYVPSVEQFATYFMSSGSAQRESNKVKKLLRRAMTLRNKTVKGSKFTYIVPIALPCAVALEVPEAKVLEAQIRAFLHPPKNEIEDAKEEGRDR